MKRPSAYAYLRGLKAISPPEEGMVWKGTCIRTAIHSHKCYRILRIISHTIMRVLKKVAEVHPHKSLPLVLVNMDGVVFQPATEFK